MGRDATADATPLLKAAEQNIGNSDRILPQAGTVGTTIPQTNPTRLIQLSGGSAAGQSTSVVVTASRIVGNQNPNPGFPGPITGVIEFGNGGRSTRAEFDIPIGPFLGTISVAADASEPQDGGVIITVPTGVMRVYARYDNLLLAPVLGSNQSLAQIRGVGVFGPGGPVPGPGGAVPAEPVLAKAMSAYFSRHFARAYKTLYCYCCPGAGLVPIVVGDPVVASYDFFCLPAFAKTVKILRVNHVHVAPATPTLPAIQVVLHNGIRITDLVDVTAGTSCPDIKVEGNENIVGIKSATAGDTVTFLAISCEIGI